MVGAAFMSGRTPNYFVRSSGGSDAANGLTPATAFATIAHALVVAGANKMIGLLAGSRFPVSFAPSASGQSFVAYGVGAKPLVTGFDLVTGWTLSSGTIYRATLATAPGVVYYDDVTRLTSAGASTTPTSSQFGYTGGQLYVNVGVNPTGHTVEAAQRGLVVDLTGFDNIRISGLQIDGHNTGGFGNCCIFIWHNTQDRHDITIENCTGGRCVGSWLSASNAGFETANGGHQNYNIFVRNNTVKGCGYGGINFGLGMNDSEITGNDVSECNMDPASQFYAGIRTFGGFAGLVTNSLGDVSTDTGFRIKVNYNHVHHIHGTAGTGPNWQNGNGIHRDTDNLGGETLGNLVHDCDTNGLNQELMKGHRTASNLVYSCGYYGILLFRSLQDQVVEHNTSFGHGKSSLGYYGEGRSGAMINARIKNNILFGSVGSQLQAALGGDNTGGATGGSGNVYLNNCLGVDSSTTLVEWGFGNFLTYAGWATAYGSTTASVQANPLVVNTATADFHLQSGSPCRGAGATGLATTLDKDGKTFLSPPDIGAYQF